LWIESSHLVRPGEGILIADDTTLDKPYAKKMDLVGTIYFSSDEVGGRIHSPKSF